MLKEVKSILAENERRVKKAKAPFDPITGFNSTGERKRVVIKGFPIPNQHPVLGLSMAGPTPAYHYLPVKMLEEPFIKLLVKKGLYQTCVHLGLVANKENLDSLIELYARIRARYDFPFWCAAFVRIKPKGGGENVPFILRPAQRKLVEEGFGIDKVLSEAVRLIILKARQWGGSTCTQLYFAWLQLVHEVGLNSLICAQVKDTAIEIMDMFYTAINDYPLSLLHDLGESYDAKETKWAGVLNAQNVHRVPQRKCKIKVGSVEKPDSCRGGDYNLVHCSEVGVWKKTDGKSPEDIIDSATGGMGLDPLTMIVYESTAKGTGNFFHREYMAAKQGESQFRALFLPWYEIPDRYWKDFDERTVRGHTMAESQLPVPGLSTAEAFATWLYQNRYTKTASSNREEPGEYLWSLWLRGATLESINWYIQERRKFNDHGHMASEYPSDDIEAFVHSGARVFDPYHVEAFRPACRDPKFIGDVVGKAIKGKEALQELHFVQTGTASSAAGLSGCRPTTGGLKVWALPEHFPGERVMHRYLTVVDIGGRSRKADWSVITVFDRYEMMEGGRPAIVAQWRGHIDHDLLAWKAAQIAAFYDNSLLVIESNTLETKDKNRDVDGDQSGYILNQIKDVYPNLYARQIDSENKAEGEGTKWGFHTNTKTKPEIISNLIECVREHLYIERDKDALDELLTYEKTLDGVYQAIEGLHDDILMTRAIGLWICFRVMPQPYFIKLTEQKYTYAVNI